MTNDRIEEITKEAIRKNYERCNQLDVPKSVLFVDIFTETILQVIKEERVNTLDEVREVVQESDNKKTALRWIVKEMRNISVYST